MKCRSERVDFVLYQLHNGILSSITLVKVYVDAMRVLCRLVMGAWGQRILSFRAVLVANKGHKGRGVVLSGRKEEEEYRNKAACQSSYAENVSPKKIPRPRQKAISTEAPAGGWRTRAGIGK